MYAKYSKLFLPSVLLFVFITIVFMLVPQFWDRNGVNHIVVAIANLLLFGLSMLTLWMHSKAIKNPNPNVFLTSVMGSTVLKLFVLGIATVVYLVIAGKDKSILAIIAGMVLYVAYTVLDVKSALLLNKKQ